MRFNLRGQKMKISELIEELERIKNELGDLPIKLVGKDDYVEPSIFIHEGKFMLVTLEELNNEN